MPTPGPMLTPPTTLAVGVRSFVLSHLIAASLNSAAMQSSSVMMCFSLQLVLLAPRALAEASVPMLRGLTRGPAELPSCTEKPNFHLARASWCGEQKEPMACSKEVDSPNPIWDCHLQADGWCSLGGSPCAWPEGAPAREVSSDWQNQNSQGQATRFVTWNLYVFTLAGRIHPVVDELLRMQPEIAAIPEMWHEKGAILDLLNQRSGSVWAFATGGATEQFNDADILFRTDKWEHIASDLVPFSAGRAINWAALRRKSDGYTLIASGTHPLCCQGDYVITEAVDFVTKTLSQVQNRHPYPIVLMGDLNTGYFQPSQQLLRQGQVEAFGRHWQIPMTFTDAWAELHPGNPDPSTINDDPVRLDYVYFQKTPLSVGQSIVQSQIWPRAAGSDHRAVSGDVVLNREQHFTFEYDVGVWAMGSVQVLKDRRSGVLKTCRSIFKPRLTNVWAASQELAKLKMLQHPMLSAVTDVLEDSEYLFVVSLRANGGDLAEFLERRIPSETRLYFLCGLQHFPGDVTGSFVYCFSLEEREWTEVEYTGTFPATKPGVSYQGCRFGQSCVVQGHRAWIFGGCVSNEAGGVQPTSGLFSFDLEEHHFEEIAAASPSNWPPALTAHSSVAFDGKVFVFGGGDGAQDVYCYDVGKSSWALLPPLLLGPRPCDGRVAHAVADGYVVAYQQTEGSDPASEEPNVGHSLFRITREQLSRRAETSARDFRDHKPEGMSELDFLLDEATADAAFLIDDTKLPVHRAVLRRFAPALAKVVAEKPVVALNGKGVTIPAVQHLLQHVYSRYMDPVSPAEAEMLLKLAHHFQLMPLVQLCQENIVIDASNVRELLDYASRVTPPLETLNQKCYEFWTSHPEHLSFMKSPVRDRLPSNLPTVASPELRAATESEARSTQSRQHFEHLQAHLQQLAQPPAYTPASVAGFTAYGAGVPQPAVLSQARPPTVIQPQPAKAHSQAMSVQTLPPASARPPLPAQANWRPATAQPGVQIPGPYAGGTERYYRMLDTGIAGTTANASTAMFQRLAGSLLLGSMSPPSLEDGSLESSELWEGRSEEAKEFVQFLCSDTTAAAALLHPWLRNVLLRPGMSAEQLEDDARERMACCVVALLLIPTEMAQRDAESLLQDFNSFDQDDDGLIALVSAQKIMEKRGTRQAAAEAALAVADVRGAGVLDFSAMAAAAFLGDLVPRNGAARFVDLKSRLQALFFEAYGDEEEEGRVLQSDLRSSVVNSVGEILHVHGNVRFDELLSAFAEEEIDKDELLPPLAKAAGIGTSNSLFEFGFMAHEESSWLLKLLHTCGAGSSQRRRVYSC
ncbi:unnamed protein product [Symbiodinium sp. KB8]|nr:unnamed protein product [Symbiodinium sp. KB8]